jgi:hypothetical protein
MPYNDTPNYTVNHFKPAIYAKSYFDRIFSNSGFTYSWSSLAAAHFDKLLIPYNGDVNNFDYTDYRVNADTTFLTNYTQPTGGSLLFWQTIITYTETLDIQNLFNPLTGIYTAPFNTDTTQGQTYNFNLTYSFNILLDNQSGVNAYAYNVNTFPVTPIKFECELIFRVIKNGVLFGQPITAVDIAVFDGSISNPLANGITNILTASGTSNIPFPTNVNASDTLQIQVGILPRGYTIAGVYVNPNNARWRDLTNTTNLQVNVQADLTSLNVDITPSNNIQIIGGVQLVNEFIPQKIKQSDFIKAIFQMYNLYAYTNTNQPNELILVHRDEWYDTGAEKDWSTKLAKNIEQELIFLPDLSKKKLKLTYKPDTDSPNVVYTQATAETYGQIEYTFDNEYVKDTDTKELLFSPTPVGRTLFDAYLPMINGIAANTNIRILYDVGVKTCQPFNIYEQGTTGTTGLTSYPQTGHFNDALTPTFDINFGVCDYYFYQTSVLTNNNLYNLYWRRTVNQINVGKMLIASFLLNEADIQTLKLNDKIRIDNSWWNINKVIDYNANDEVLTKVELISVDTEIDLVNFPIANPIYVGDPTTSLATGGVINFNNVLSNINLSFGNFQVFGTGNVIAPSLRGMVVGDNQSVTEDGITTNNLRITETLNGRPITEMLPTYQKYIATISQAGILDPVVTILENTLGDIVWTRSGVGDYLGTLVGAFPNQDKTYLIIGQSQNDKFSLNYLGTDDVTIATLDNAGLNQDALLNYTTIEIRVYP